MPWVLLLFLHMIGTLLTLFIFSHLMFAEFPFVLTMQGQYVMKNVSIMAAVITIWVSQRKHQRNNQ